jgi:hypothetical protein
MRPLSKQFRSKIKLNSGKLKLSLNNLSLSIHNMSLSMYKDNRYNVKFEVFTAVSMKNAVFWDVAPCRSCVNRCFGGMYRLHLQDRKTCERGHVPQKRRFTQDLHGATSQKTALFKYNVSCKPAKCCIFLKIKCVK